MSRRGGKRRPIVQLNDNKSSKLHRYGYSKELHSGKVELPNLVGAYEDSESEEESVNTDTVVPTAEPTEFPIDPVKALADGTAGDSDGLDNELRNFLSEIEAIPMPDDEPSKPISFGTSSEKTWELNAFQETKADTDVTDEEKEVEEISDKMKTNAYSMFVKGEPEFVNSPNRDVKPAESEPTEAEPMEKDDTYRDLPDEPETDWQMVQDETSHYYYYWNTLTNTVTWEIPSEYTQYLLLHREYMERIAKYSTEELQRLKERKASKSKNAKVNGGDVLDSNATPHAAPLITEACRKVLDEHNLGSREASPSSSHHKHEKKKKSHKIKKHKRRRDEDYSSEENSRRSPVPRDRHKERPIIGPSLPPVDSRLDSTGDLQVQDASKIGSKSKIEDSNKGSGLLGMGAYLSDQDDEDSEPPGESESMPQLGLEVDKVFLSNNDWSNKEESELEMPVLGAVVEELTYLKEDSLLELQGSVEQNNGGHSKSTIPPHLHSEKDEEVSSNDEEKEKEFNRISEAILTGPTHEVNKNLSEDLPVNVASENGSCSPNMKKESPSEKNDHLEVDVLLNKNEESEDISETKKDSSMEDRKEAELLRKIKADKLKKVKEAIDMFADSFSSEKPKVSIKLLDNTGLIEDKKPVKSEFMEEGELSEGFDSGSLAHVTKGSTTKTRNTSASKSEKVSPGKSHRHEEKSHSHQEHKKSITTLSIVASYGTDDEEEGELKDSDSEKLRKRKKEKKDKRKDEKRRKVDETRSSSEKKEVMIEDKIKTKSEGDRKRDSGEKTREKIRDDKDKVKAKKDKDRIEDRTKQDKKTKGSEGYHRSKSIEDKAKTKSNEDKAKTKSHEDKVKTKCNEDKIKSKSIEDKSKTNSTEDEVKANEDKVKSKSSEEIVRVKYVEDKVQPKVKVDLIDAQVTTHSVELKKPSAINNESVDIDFDDLDDLDRALEMALEKKLEEKKVELQAEEPELEETSADLLPSTQDKVAQPVEDLDLEEGETKATSDVDEEDAKTTVKEMADLAINKLEFLDLGTDNLSRLQTVFVELQTRLTDWTAGGLSTPYFLQQLQVAEGLLTEYELSAVPDGWACQWDRANNRYYYRHKATERIQWEYPEVKEQKQRKKESRSERSSARDRESSPVEERKSRSSRHRKREDREKDRDKDRSKHEKRSRSERHRRKRRRHRDHSSSSGESHASSQATSSRRQHKSKKKKRQRSRSRSRSASVEVVKVKEAEPIEVRDESPPPAPSSVASPTPPDSLTPLPSSPAPPSPPPPETQPPVLYLAPAAIESEGRPDDENIDGEMMEPDDGDKIDETAKSEEVRTEEEEEANPAIISRPPVITKPQPHVVAMQPPELYVAPTVPPPPAEVSPPAEDTPPTESSQATTESEKQAKKKKKDKKLATGSNIMMKKKHMSSMVQKWQKVKKEVEKEEKDKEAREAAIRQKIKDLK